MSSIVITHAKRTPVGSFQGSLSSFSSTDLGAHAISAIVKAGNLKENEVNDVIMGCVLSGGLGQAPARQAALKAGLSNDTNCFTLNKVCGSGLKSVMIAYDMLRLKETQLVIAGGMESMTNAPYLMPGARGGYRIGTKEVIDHMMFDGLEDTFTGGSAMGLLADKMAESRNYSRQAQDDFAISSGKKAQAAQTQGHFTSEIVPLTFETRKGITEITEDEPPQKVLFDKIPHLRPVFRKEGTLTAANSSPISDGAAAVLVMHEEEAKKRGLKPMAKICGQASFSREPELFTLAPVGAIDKLMKSLNWSAEDVDLFEINEAFACVTMAAIDDLKIDPAKVNVHGGACALGHPIGASGTRLLVTLLHALETYNKKRGIVSLCIGGGEAVALAVERL